MMLTHRINYPLYTIIDTASVLCDVPVISYSLYLVLFNPEYFIYNIGKVECRVDNGQCLLNVLFLGTLTCIIETKIETLAYKFSKCLCNFTSLVVLDVCLLLIYSVVIKCIYSS
jgi:hypothetical protein